MSSSDRPASGVARRDASAFVEHSLASRLAQVLRDDWQQGEFRTADDVLREHPEASSDPDVVVRLIYEEICLRESRGEVDPVADCLRRYPQWRREIEAVMACHRWLAPILADPSFPNPGEYLGEYAIVCELGRGAHGRVYLAEQPDLASRLVVLKTIPYSSHEHLKLARLQHTNIVPLYSVRDVPDRGLRTLCMPYLGGATLDKFLPELQAILWHDRSGQSLVDLMDRRDVSRREGVPTQGPARKFLQRASYVDAVCWMGVCVADAVHYAHEQGLLHLDIKPSNVLVSADGRPMLLDFHLARRAVLANAEFPDGVGGTPRYMSPEQRIGWQAAREGRPIPVAIDARSDLYSLGLVLRDFLIEAPDPRNSPCAIHSAAPTGLQDIVARCLSTDVARRYASAAELADDLRRQMANLPLRGVRNRSVVERWRKWRRRRPQAALVAALAVVLLGVLTAVGVVAWYEWHNRWIDANSALASARSHRESRQFDKAAQECASGLERIGSFAFLSELGGELQRERVLVRQGQAIKDLGILVEHIRYLYGNEAVPLAVARQVDQSCREAWAHRQAILAADLFSHEPALEREVRSDLMDLMIVWTDLRSNWAGRGGPEFPPQKAIQELEDAETLLGSSFVLREEMRRYRPEAPSLENEAGGSLSENDQPATAWEWYAAGRVRMAGRDFDGAISKFERALDLAPDEFWSNFCLGLCRYRLERFDEAREAFQIAIALRPSSAECYYNRALAHVGLNEMQNARSDLERALSIDPGFGAAMLNLGVLNLLDGRLGDAETALGKALAMGADAGIVHYNLALVCRARNDRAGALENLDRALEHDEDMSQAEDLKTRMTQEPTIDNASH